MSTTLEQPSEEMIDALIPPPRRWWLRLIIGVAIVGLLGAAAYGYGYGAFYPRPDCCGSASGASMMGLSPDGKAVTITATMYNSSGHDLIVQSAAAKLPGAEVLGITMMNDVNAFTIPMTDVLTLPRRLARHQLSRLVITFVPESCIDVPGKPWGSVDVELDIANVRFFSFGRTYRLPDSVVDGPNLSVFWPSGDSAGRPSTPLAAACALLGR